MGAYSISRRAFIAGTAATAASAAVGQTYDKYVRVILPVGAGSGVDAIARVMSPGLSKALGHNVVIENLPGAGGVLGASQLLKAPKDGLTIAIVSNNHVVNPSLYPNMSFDAVEDFTQISVLGGTPFALLAHPSVMAKNVPELIEFARANPGKLNYGSSGNGTILHLAGEMLLSEAKIKIQHIPYRSAGQLLQDLLGGQIELAFFAVNVAAQHVKAGSLRALGMSPATRSPLLPDVPTIAEQGLPNYAIEGWFAAIGPAGLPAPEVVRLHSAFVATLTNQEIRDVLIKQGNTINPTTPDEAARYFRSERDRYARIVKAAGIKID